jgi:hypothetical protein
MDIATFKNHLREEALYLLKAIYSDVERAITTDQEGLELTKLATELDAKTELTIDLARASSSIVVATALEQVIETILANLEIS